MPRSISPFSTWESRKTDQTKSNQKQKRLQIPNLWKDCHELLLLESLQVAWKSWIYPTSNACSSKGHSFSTHMIAKQLCSQSSSLKNKSLLHKENIHIHARNSSLWPLHGNLLLALERAPALRWPIPVSGCCAWLAFILLSIYPQLS